MMSDESVNERAAEGITFPEPLMACADREKAAEQFIEDYYKVANLARSSLASFYVPSDATRKVPSILFNGNEISGGKGVQDLFEKQIPKSHFEIESIDCHILNPSYPAAQQTQQPRFSTNNTSLLVMVNGICKFGIGDREEDKDFSETFILVPNPEASQPRHLRGQQRKEHLIETQNFRIVTQEGERPTR